MRCLALGNPFPGVRIEDPGRYGFDFKLTPGAVCL